MNTTTKNIANGIQSGAVTHHHDQSISPVNFNVMNIRNKIIPKPIPFELLLLIFYFNIQIFFCL